MALTNKERAAADQVRKEVVDALTDLFTDPSKPVARHLYHFNVVAMALSVDEQLERVLDACTPIIRKPALLAEARDEVCAALMIACANRLLGRPLLKLC